MTPVVKIYQDIHQRKREIEEVKAFMKECGNSSKKDGTDAMFTEELERLTEEIAELEGNLFATLMPKDISEQGSAILEVRPGTGGDEAALFADEIFRLYQRYALQRGWRFDPLSINREGNMLKEGMATLTGEGVFSDLMFESGVHRVQRVPATEGQGRIHTSTVTVAILSQPSQVQVDIKESDIRVDVYRASGAGGQHVNTTDSAVRITHFPTGIMVAIQDERSQHKNRAKAMKVLRARVYELERTKVQRERRDQRSKLIGRGERSEKIRTYNFPKNRVTDHRIHLTLYNLDAVMEGTGLVEFIEHLRIQHYMDLLSQMGSGDSQ
ncbi:hypothetical protein IWQ61_003484 [Dispira simplex]|nr:hypothetical protein IWQ61_003484 [Dispira simplex]